MIFSGVLFARVGGVLGLFLMGLPFTISAGVGFVALAGASMLEGLVLVSAIRDRMALGMTKQAAIEDARLARLRPVLMTGAVAALGFVPMMLSTGIGAEVQKPLATVVVFGMASDTFLTMLALPVLYLLFGKGPKVEAADSHEHERTIIEYHAEPEPLAVLTDELIEEQRGPRGLSRTTRAGARPGSAHPGRGRAHYRRRQSWRRALPPTVTRPAPRSSLHDAAVAISCALSNSGGRADRAFGCCGRITWESAHTATRLPHRRPGKLGRARSAFGSGPTRGAGRGVP